MFGVKVLQCVAPATQMRPAANLRLMLQQPVRTFFGKKKPVMGPADIPRDHRVPLPCDVCMKHNDPKPCFNMENVSIELATTEHENLIRAFLYTNYWPREPSCIGLYMSLDSLYLNIMSDKYACSGDRFLAFEWQGRGKERKLIGLLVAGKTFPWVADELEDWAVNTMSKPDRIRMFFLAHCLRNADLFNKYKVDSIYEVEVLATASEVMRQGVGLLLLKRAIFHACESAYPLTIMVAKSKYGAITCERAGMKEEWSLDYKQFIDSSGLPQFYPRIPHLTVNIYSHTFDCNKDAIPYPCEV